MCEDLGHMLFKTVFTENQARRYFTQIVEATVCCEENGVVHRDLKPENILFDMETNEIKIIDFGLASDVQYEPYNMFRGEKSVAKILKVILLVQVFIEYLLL